MLSTVYVACLLAASAVATPAHHAPRSFASYSQDAAHADENQNLQASSGPFGSSMSQAYSKNSAASHNSGTAYNGGVGFGGGLDGAVGYGGIDSGYGGQAAFGNAQGGYNAMSANANSYNAMSSNTNGFNAGGLGGYASGGSSFSSTQQSSSISSVSSSFQSLNGMIGGLQSQLASGQLTRAVAFQQCQRLAQYFQSVLAQANQCGACFDGQGQFGSVASSTMSQFTSFMSQLQSTFGANAFGQIASPFSTLSSSFQQFFQRSSSSSSFSSTSIVPQNFGPVMQPIMPTLMPTLQQLDPNSFPLGGLGGYSAGGSSFSSTQQSSSVSSVSSGFQSLNGMIGGLQSQLAAGQLTRAVAFQQCQRLAQYFQSVLTQANRCGTCFEGQGQFGSVASSTMSQFTSFMSQLQSSFGANAYGQIASPFATLSSSFQQFFQRSSSSSSFSSTSIVPQNFGPVMQPIMPTLMPALQQLAFHKK